MAAIGGGDATTDAARKYHRPALVAGADLLAVLRPRMSNDPLPLSPFSTDHSYLKQRASVESDVVADVLEPETNDQSSLKCK